MQRFRAWCQQAQARLPHQRVQGAGHLQNRHMSDRRGEVTMKTSRNITKAISFAALLVTALASRSLPARSQEAARYSKMAPVDQYLMTDRSAEIAMARSAAPPSISADAEVMVLGRHG